MALHGRMYEFGSVTVNSYLMVLSSTRLKRSTSSSVRGGTLQARLATEVDCLDDERVAFPAAARVAGPLAQRGMRSAVGRDDAGVVHHLVDDHHVSGGLHNLQVVVVGARGHRRTGIEADEAAVGESPVLVRVAEAGVRSLRPFCVPAARGLGERNCPVRGIDNERRAFVGRQPAATLVPELVVRQHAAFGPRRVPRARLPFDRIEQITIEPRVFRRFEGGSLLLGECALSGQRFRALEWCDRAERIDALEVWLPIGCPGWSRGFALSRCGERRQRHRSQQGEPFHQQAIAHCDPPCRRQVDRPRRQRRRTPKGCTLSQFVTTLQPMRIATVPCLSFPITTEHTECTEPKTSGFSRWPRWPRWPRSLTLKLRPYQTSLSALLRAYSPQP